ncbi:xanthine-guanine phosphoribosyltransferase, partial [mine drainage metagenome]
MAELPRCRQATWADVDRWADRLAERIRGQGDPPDVLVGVTRGGWVPTRLLSDRIGTRRVVSLRIQHWGVTATPSGAAEVTEELSGPVRGHRALIVDDIADTGESLHLARERVARDGALSVETAACLYITHSKLIPTYFAEEIDRSRWVWIIFPWNYWEDLRTLVERTGAPTPEQAKTLLSEQSGVEFPIDDIDRVFPMNAPRARGARSRTTDR